METKNITIKLLIDTKANKVLFAEASKDFVDFLFFLLSLPIATVVKLLANKSMVDSIGNLYKSLEILDETYMQPTAGEKSQLLNPTASTAFTNVPLLTTGSSTSSSGSKKFYTCENCKRYITYMYGARCPGCSRLMFNEIKCLPDANTSTTDTASSNNKDPEGYVKEAVVSYYMILDDLSVTPMSMISSISMMKKFNISHINVLQEKAVEIGSEEGLELLKTYFQSSTVLTDVFMRKKKANKIGLKCEHLSSMKASLLIFYLSVLVYLISFNYGWF